MPLFPNLRAHQVFGANTEVGKTLLTTALLRASASRFAETSAEAKKRVFYLKPVSTGPDSESDTSYVNRNTKPWSDYISTRNLYQYREPMSPHLAAKLAPDLPFPKTNEELVRGIESYTEQCLKELNGEEGALFVETAGGVHSPALHPPHTQSTFLRSLRLPSVLVASPHLGGISTTISAYESLLVRGYSLSAVLCLYDPYYRNHTFLEDYFKDRGIGYWTIKTPPEKYGTVEEDGVRLEEWYKDVERSVEGELGGGVGDAARWLEDGHKKRIEELGTMPQRTLDSVWWPFTQHQLINKKEDVMVVDSAYGDNFDAFYTKPEGKEISKNESLLKSYFDGSASWFTQSHGHANEHLTLAAASAAGRYGHVLFPSGTNAPALELAEKLLSTVGQDWASRVFYSDNGSTAMEVGLKMALRAAGRRYGWDGELGGDVGVIGLRGSYHGDTIGSMDATQASTFNKAVDWYRGRGHWFSPPMVQFVDGKPSVLSTAPDSWPTLPSSLSSTPTPDGWQVAFPSYEAIYDISSRSSSPLATYYRAHIRETLERLTKEGKKFGALVMEPTCLGAGGMVFVDPLFQSCMVEVVRASGDLFAKEWDGGSYEQELEGLKTRDGGEWQGLPVLYDEVFSGLNRFGYNSAASVLGHTPDISAYAKILTGGLLPLSTTLASPSIFKAFLSDHKVDALLHGHSYTANPIGCSVALEAIKLTQEYEKKGGWQGEKKMWGVEDGGRWSFWKKEFVEGISQIEGVKGAMAMGTVVAIELQDDESDYSSHVALEFLNDLRKITVSPSSSEAESITPFSPFQIHSRPLGNVVYLITSLWTKPEVMRAMEGVIEERLKSRAEFGEVLKARNA
ncbi:dethiobiotin synthase [Cryptococcus amylolentus CBS 6039]|uniref:Dethiobiotin synthase n=2 Tax=Cryptococcus amylolentus TaxID=104669 RepID=A0A1E3I8R1_9TREE|nr:dethiobiotin synthase [Cryptococcus amylolentus CBS 6039]ODN84878.1 dethiobiotin synthase [Cryptococcus amylolentus CBS 6039]ODO11411.1 dethiobiotin synthase [Cryptococcus amylolentus CBS 6273]